MPPDNDEGIKVGLSPKEVVRELPLYTNLLRTIIIILLFVFTLGNITCLTLFVLNGLGITNLSDTALCALAATTVGEVAGLLLIVLKKLI